jgi:ribonucleoside-diphosphate reductase alpha chain
VHAAPALRPPGSDRHGRAHFRIHARHRLPRLGRTGQGARRLPAVQRRAVPLRRQLRLAPAGRVKAEIRKHGLRNSHLLSIAPTGTISLAFADNASNGIEPPFSWTYNRKKRMADGTLKEYAVEDYAWRLYKHLGGDVDKLPDYFVTALEISAQAHKDMVAAVAPYIDTSISKTVNVPADYPYEDFQDLYMSAWKSGLKGSPPIAPTACWARCCRSNRTKQVEDRKAAAGLRNRRRQPPPVDQEPARAGALQPALARPPEPAGRQHGLDLHDRAPARQVRPLRRPDRAGRPRLAVRSLGQRPEQPRGLGAVAKTLSMDMRANDHGWLKLKLESLAKTRTAKASTCPSRRTASASACPRWSPRWPR